MIPALLLLLVKAINLARALCPREPVVDDQAVLAQFPELINVLSQLKEHPQVKSLPLEIDLLSAESVSYQLAGLIPITPSQKQSLLEAFDSKQRMNLLEKLVNQISENSV